MIVGFDYRSTAVADAKMAYVASTRGRSSIKIFCDSKEDLSLVANRSGDAPLATEEFFKEESQRPEIAAKLAHPVKRLSEWIKIPGDKILNADRKLKTALSDSSPRHKIDADEKPLQRKLPIPLRVNPQTEPAPSRGMRH